MKNLVSTIALGAVVAIAPFAANAAAQVFDNQTTSSVSINATLKKAVAADANEMQQKVPTNPLLVTDKVLVEAYNDAITTAVETINTQINGLSVNGGGDVTSGVTQIVEQLMKQNINVAQSWDKIKTTPSGTTVPSDAYFQDK